VHIYDWQLTIVLRHVFEWGGVCISSQISIWNRPSTYSWLGRPTGALQSFVVCRQVRPVTTEWTLFTASHQET